LLSIGFWRGRLSDVLAMVRSLDDEDMELFIRISMVEEDVWMLSIVYVV